MDKLSAFQLVNMLRIDVSVRTVQLILQNDYFSECVSMRARLNLSPVHSQKRIKWARAMMVKCASFWRKVTFTDETVGAWMDLMVTTTTGPMQVYGEKFSRSELIEVEV